MLAGLHRTIVCDFALTLCVSKNGNVFLFGNSELGIQEEDNHIPKIIPSLQNIFSVDCGVDYFTCLDINGNVYTFGDN